MLTLTNNETIRQGMILKKKLKIRQGAWDRRAIEWRQKQMLINITKIFLIELQIPIVVKVEMNCKIKELYRIKTNKLIKIF